MKKYLELVQGQFTAEHAEKAMQTEYPYVAYSVENDEVMFNFEPQITRMVLTKDSGDELSLSANGLVIVEYVQDGAKIRNTYSALSNTYVPIPAGAEATIYGSVTYINSDNADGVFLSLDVSKNIALTDLYCSNCPSLTSLDVSNNIALIYLDCSNCPSLTSLDISNNIALMHLNCYNCTGITSLDVSKNTALTSLTCGGCTGLTSLDVSKNTALTYLECGNCTGLTSLDVSKNTALTNLDCSGCQNLLMLNIKNTAELASGAILDQSMANLTTLQVAGTSAWAYEQVESWLSDFAPDGGMIYVDENTSQEVITAATAKSWTVEYVDA